MTVHELITELQKYPADAAIKIGLDRLNWPEVGLALIEYLAEDPSPTAEDRELLAAAEEEGDLVIEKGSEFPRVIFWIADHKDLMESWR
jgi:hypothetical protein